ncbi:hypothetical protein T12_2322 [Trichinella patagoniensis]|uniref:Uncharacterized protein n=2 Tax=Trichinella patagoniensis TaxID=990121 RepID=A0A0V0YVF7_9BILA|nr:hypothetical protein T12_2322 [Trichinella patagoniensis]
MSIQSFKKNNEQKSGILVSNSETDFSSYLTPVMNSENVQRCTNWHKPVFSALELLAEDEV